jgi:nucleotide-binding universal stress UspA family protein
MTYRTLMVHVDIGGSNEKLFQIAGNIAERFDAKVIGIAACMPPQPTYYTGAYPLGDFLEEDRAAIKTQIETGEQKFRSALKGRCQSMDWRFAYRHEPVATYLAREARAADLILIDRKAGNTDLDPSRRVVISDLLTAVGRPVLVSQADCPMADVREVMIGWKDTREAQRAVVAALPLVKIASHVSIVSVVPEQGLFDAHEAVKEVAGWLKQHGVVAETQTTLATRDDASQLEAIAKEKRAGLIIAGAYGHSRLREWIMGGVTRDLVVHSERCAFLSH